jgi:hypothetical protein
MISPKAKTEIKQAGGAKICDRRYVCRVACRIGKRDLKTKQSWSEASLRPMRNFPDFGRSTRKLAIGKAACSPVENATGKARANREL